MDNSTNKNLQLWLKTNHLLDDSNDTLLKQYIQPIIQLFGGYKSILYLLSKSANHSQLESMHSKIKSIKINYESTQNQKSHENPYVTSTEKEANKNYFTTLPNELIAHINGFLTKHDMKSFKHESKQIGTVCLQKQIKFL